MVEAASTRAPQDEDADERRRRQPVRLALYVAALIALFHGGRAAVLDGVDVAEGDE